MTLEGFLSALEIFAGVAGVCAWVAVAAVLSYKDAWHSKLSIAMMASLIVFLIVVIFMAIAVSLS